VEEGRKFGLTVGIAFIVIGSLAWWRDVEILPWALGVLGFLMILGGAVLPHRMGPVHSAWMAMAHAISKVTTPIFLSIVYFLVLTPSGFIRRLVSGTPLHRRRIKSGYWVPREGDVRSDMTRQF